ncbi:metal-dependent transcriptional regulator [Bifidobacterium sp.]|jgi:DtxR family Mn-dependent transcriptional regulator|uniref:metal-dependent transcriptional regulator n=1 Tax=Bifidobacterium sp. TaxID=41200 RepID=UPI0025C4723B|nr:metal-dependent transcriptional regulator [Bifidobacterium sp.]MCH4209393.1 metal-dependent transcriptional regulator [Bifidobacterium sp.]MCI1224972.1 metal-dependent transcriptional regulator [Bifidobacterium sp.]
MALQDLSSNAQDYLKVIWGLHEWGRTPVQPSDLANRAHVKPSTVSGAVTRLVSGGYARHDPYGAIELTGKGEHYALAMVRRHRLLETFLVSALHYSWDEVHAEADALEHAASDMMIDRIDEMLGHPATDPHGDPIPRANGSLPDVAQTPLSAVPEGTSVAIERVSDEDPSLLRYLDTEGIAIGTAVCVAGHDAQSGTVTLVPLQAPEASSATPTALSSKSAKSGRSKTAASSHRPLTLPALSADHIHVRILDENTVAEDTAEG